MIISLLFFGFSIRFCVPNYDLLIIVVLILSQGGLLSQMVANITDRIRDFESGELLKKLVVI